MKMLTLLLAIFISTLMHSQNCGVGSVFLGSQSDVNAFVTVHTAPNPTCNRIDGNLYIGSFTGTSNINDISGLSFLTSTNTNLNLPINDIGSLTIENTSLINLDGLDNFSSVSGSLSIYTNDFLTNINALSGLVEVGEDIGINGNNVLISIRALGNIAYVENNISVSDNSLLDICCSLGYFINGLNFIGGNLFLNNNNSNCNSEKIVITSCNSIYIDSDNDGIVDNVDNCPFFSNLSQTDVDNDGIGDVCDNCPNTANNNQDDIDNDGIGNVCERNAGTENAGLGIGTTDPKSQLEVTLGDVFIKNSHRGIIMKSPLGKCFRVQITEDGSFKSKEMTCPDN
ncbi:MAG: thrombospondin type 3 repeat-containing protein [Flavobacteriaceae bacterium]